MQFKICNSFVSLTVRNNTIVSEFDSILKKCCNKDSILVFDGTEWKVKSICDIIPSHHEEIVGYTGATGPIGEKGPRGFQGIQGEQGIEGMLGPRGLRGEIGYTGYTGPAGNAGNDGIGYIGYTGPALFYNDDTSLYVGSVPSFKPSSETTSFGINAGLSNGNGSNSFFGFESGKNCGGSNNAFFGDNICSFSNEKSTGNNNSIFGSQAGLKLESGSNNSFFGMSSGANNTSGTDNTFAGMGAGNDNTVGYSNTFIGTNSGGASMDGVGCVCIGDNASTTIDMPLGQISIGKDVNAYADNTVNFPDNLTTFPNGTEVNFSSANGGCLFPVSSSIRWKDNVEDIDKFIDTSKLYDLRPVTYNPAAGHGNPEDLFIGLIAEEVNEIFPVLVPKDKHGLPASVRYSLLSVLLLAELKKLRNIINGDSRYT